MAFWPGKTHTQTHIFLHILIHIHTLLHSYKYAHSHIYTQAHTHTHSCTYSHTGSLTHTHIHIHVHKLTHTNAHCLTSIWLSSICSYFPANGITDLYCWKLSLYNTSLPTLCQWTSKLIIMHHAAVNIGMQWPVIYWHGVFGENPDVWYNWVTW